MKVDGREGRRNGGKEGRQTGVHTGIHGEAGSRQARAEKLAPHRNVAGAAGL